MQTVQNKIDSLQDLWVDLMEEYRGLVSGYGMGHSIPDDKSQKATELMNHAENIREQISELKAKAGIEETTTSKKSNAKKGKGALSLKDRDYKWAVHILAKLIGSPRLFFEMQMLNHALTFIQKYETDPKLFLKISDNPKYMEWFKDRYKTALLFCIQSIQQGATSNDQTQKVLWVIKTLSRYNLRPDNQIAYQYFKDEYFGDGINQAV